MNPTQDESQDPSLFTTKSFEWAETNGIRDFENAYEAVALIETADAVADSYIRRLQEEGMGYSYELILQFGSALGEAYRMIFTGNWYFSQNQGRWVVQMTLPKGDIMEINIFNKVEKRFELGMEDSIGYMFEGTKKIFLEQVRELEASAG